MTTNAVLQVKDVVKEFKRGQEVVLAVNNINLGIKSGSMVAIVGPSGSGKSTLLHLMGALDKPTKGKVILEDKNLVEFSDKELTLVRRRRIGFIFQFFNLLPGLPTWQNIALPLLVDGTPPAKAKKEAEKLASKLKISHRLDTQAGLLSGGEMQRTAIARALIINPAIILGDEPTGNLDSKTAGEVVDILKSLAKNDGRTVVIVTHDINIANSADRIIKIVDGEIANESIFSPV